MKRLTTLAIALVLVLSLSVSAFAMEVPTAAEVRNLNGVQQYVKTYTVRADADPQELIEEPFDYDGFTYSYASIVKQENRFADKAEHTEIVTVETAKKDLATVLAELPVSVEYDDGRYSGTLYLDHNTIETTAAGYTKKSYTCTTTKEYDNLPSNDMSYIASTATKDGYTLPLTNVEWTAQSTALVDDVLVPATYKAVATYSDKVSYSSATGYITTAEYFGTVTCDEVASITYTVTYIGTPIVVEEPEPVIPVENEPSEPVPDRSLAAEEANSFAANKLWNLAFLAIVILCLVSAVACLLISFMPSGKSKKKSKQQSVEDDERKAYEEDLLG